MSETIGFTRELLEKALGEPIERIETSMGSELGDGFMCNMFKADVWTKKEPTKARHIIVKCFPETESRQALLDHGNLFEVELELYDTVIPALNKLVESSAIPIQLPFAPFVYGQQVPRDQRKKLGRPLKPLDNCIIMPDMRHPSNGNFGLRDRFKGFDLDHHKLVMEGQATLHAVSWAYKCRHGLTNLLEKFPVLDSTGAQLWKGLVPFYEANMNSLEKWCPNYSGPIGNLRKVYHSVPGLYFGYDGGQVAKGHTKDNVLKKPGLVVENEEPWGVLQHGDVWSNNLMFRYDEKTNKPAEVIFIDLQLCKDGDPFYDICGSLFMNAEPNLRKKHLTSLLHVYFDRFTQICDSLSVPYLPNWSWEEFNRRFHRATIFGGFMAMGVLFVTLRKPEGLENIEDVMSKGESEKERIGNDTEEAFKDIGDFFSNVKKSDIHPSAFDRIQSVLEDLVEYGVL